MRLIPILFSGPMVRANLEGRKRMTRRLVKRLPMHEDHGEPIWDRAWVDGSPNNQYLKVQYGTVESHPAGGTVQRHYCRFEPGDVLWVRETWQRVGDAFYHRATDEKEYASVLNEWKPSIHMPYAACRLWLRVKSVRVERVQDISSRDACAEGYPIPTLEQTFGPEAVVALMEFSKQGIKPMVAPPVLPDAPAGPRAWYSTLWDSINGKGSWAANPWVWVVEYERTEKTGGAA